MNRLMVLFALSLALPVCGPAQTTSAADHPGGPPTSLAPSLEERLTSHEGLVYARHSDRELALDLYRPKAAGDTPLPAIVCIHGGGWWQGTRENHGNLAKALAAKGYVAATISYRLSGEAPFPAQIHDCKAAVRFLRANAAKYGINPEKIGATGLSAGGHLTALLATSGSVAAIEGSGNHDDQSSAIQAAVPMGAQTDFRRHYDNIEKSDPKPVGGKPNIWLQFMGARPSEAPERWRLASPITHLDANDPPMLFITGENDNDTTHAAKFREQMKAVNIPEDLHVIPGAPHAFPGRQKWFDEMLEVSAAWFDTHLKSAESLQADDAP